MLNLNKYMIKIIFQYPNGERHEVHGKEGDVLTELAEEHDINLPSACAGNATCGTCHVHLDQQYFDLLPEKIDEEEDTLEVVNNRTDFSRLGCQVILTPKLDGMVVYVQED